MLKKLTGENYLTGVFFNRLLKVCRVIPSICADLLIFPEERFKASVIRLSSICPSVGSFENEEKSNETFNEADDFVFAGG